LASAATALCAVQFQHFFSTARRAVATEIVSRELFADQNQNARYKRYDSHCDCANPNVKERSDPDKNQIDSEQQHSNVFCHTCLF
jgi:hypothetical protein